MGDEEDPNLRLLTLSDSVIAVAITLLVLDIRLPEVAQDVILFGAGLYLLWAGPVRRPSPRRDGISLILLPFSSSMPDASGLGRRS